MEKNQIRIEILKLKKSPYVANVINERSEEILLSPLKDLEVDVVSGMVILSGHPHGIDSALEIVKQIECDTLPTEEIASNNFICRIFEDKRAWNELVDRCGSDASSVDLLSV